MTALLKDVLEQFGLPENPKTHAIPKSLVEKWLRSDDLEVLGALYTFLMKGEYAHRVQPGLSFDEYRAFIIPYTVQLGIFRAGLEQSGETRISTTTG
jgi:hypothetical protein